MKRTTGRVIASAAAALVIAGAAGARAEPRPAHPAQAAAEEQVMCKGVNECAGKGACAGMQGGCAGMNTCRGKGLVSTTKRDCLCRGGAVDEGQPRQR